MHDHPERANIIIAPLTSCMNCDGARERYETALCSCYTSVLGQQRVLSRYGYGRVKHVLSMREVFYVAAVKLHEYGLSSYLML